VKAGKGAPKKIIQLHKKRRKRNFFHSRLPSRLAWLYFSTISSSSTLKTSVEPGLMGEPGGALLP
jgi:hypothetical protein